MQKNRNTKNFIDRISPGVVKFYTSYYVLGDTFRSVWAIREYPPCTESRAILSGIADRKGVTLRIYDRPVSDSEQKRIVQNAMRKHKMESASNDITEAVNAESGMQEVVELLATLRQNREGLLHCAVFIEIQAESLDALKVLQSEVLAELTREKLTIDRLTLRQQEGFLTVSPFGSNRFGAEYERVLPASAVANLFPFHFSGKTDPHGLYLGRDKHGTTIACS